MPLARPLSASFLLVLLASPAVAQERVDADAMARIRDEGMNRSQVMEVMSTLTDVYGARLTSGCRPRT